MGQVWPIFALQLKALGILRSEDRVSIAEDRSIKPIVEMEDFLASFKAICLDLLREEEQQPVAEHIKTDDLEDEVDLSLPDEALSSRQFESQLRNLVLKTPKTATNRFFNQLFGGRNEKAVLGDLLAVVLNNSMYTYKVAGAQIGVEKTIINKLCEMLGFGPDSDGTIAPGGSMTNLMAMIMARDAARSDVGNAGVERGMVCYSSEECHYSIAKNAAFIGVGRSNVRYIKADEFGRMRTDLLESQIEKDIQEGFQPFMVNATAGTTVLGAFDPIDEISQICKKRNIWLHVDGAYCGAVMFSPTYKNLIKGVEKADSFSFNAHKMLGTPLTCSLIVVKSKQQLLESFSSDADYLYQGDSDEFNLGKTSLQCGRRNDALKLWTLWKGVGTSGLADIVDQQFFLADVARDYIRNHPDYTLYSFDDSISICFNYKGFSAQKLCSRLYTEAELMVSHGSFNGQFFVRMVTINAGNGPDDILAFFKALEEFAMTHEAELLEVS